METSGLRVGIARAMIVIAAGGLAISLFLPAFCMIFMAGVTPVGACVSLWDASPYLTTFQIVLLAFGAIAVTREKLHFNFGSLVAASLMIFMTIALAVFSYFVEGPFVHPISLVVLFASAILLLLAPWVAKERGEPLRLQFQMRSMLIGITLLAVFLGSIADILRELLGQ